MDSYSAHQNFILRGFFFPIKRNTECGGSEQKHCDHFSQQGMKIECEFVQWKHATVHGLWKCQFLDTGMWGGMFFLLLIKTTKKGMDLMSQMLQSCSVFPQELEFGESQKCAGSEHTSSILFLRSQYLMSRQITSTVKRTAKLSQISYLERYPQATRRSRSKS